MKTHLFKIAFVAAFLAAASQADVSHLPTTDVFAAQTSSAIAKM